MEVPLIRSSDRPNKFPFRMFFAKIKSGMSHETIDYRVDRYFNRGLDHSIRKESFLRMSILNKVEQWAKRPVIVYCFFALLSITFLTIPLIQGEIPLGWDMSFHYNRFYEAAMQIKQGNFSYFLQLYSFNSSGRIVNALYSPFLAYLNGGLLLLSGTWFRYYLLSSWLLYFLGMSGLYYTMRRLKVQPLLSLGLSVIYGTTATLNFWATQQTMKTWAVVFFPMALLPALHYLQTGQIKKWHLAISMALLIQIHLLSALFLSLAYLILYGYGWIRSDKKKKDLLAILLAAFLSLLMSCNVWLAILSLSTENTLLPVYVNSNLISDTIDNSGIYHIRPKVMIYLIIAIAVLFLRKPFKQWSRTTQGMGLIAGTFLLLSTSLFPWRLLGGRGLNLVELIQFPYRFLDYALPSILVLGGMILTVEHFSKRTTFFLTGLILFVMAYGLVHVQNQMLHKLNDFTTNDLYVKSQTSASDFKKAAHHPDLSQLIQLTEANMTDYVPITPGKKTEYTTKDFKEYYHSYLNNVMMDFNHIQTTVQGHSIRYEWTSSQTQKIFLPLVLYKRSHLTVNGSSYLSSNEKAGDIRFPLVSPKNGKNIAILTYDDPDYWGGILLLTLLSWIVALFLCYRESHTHVQII